MHGWPLFFNPWTRGGSPIGAGVGGGGRAGWGGVGDTGGIIGGGGPRVGTTRWTIGTGGGSIMMSDRPLLMWSLASSI